MTIPRKVLAVRHRVAKEIPVLVGVDQVEVTRFPGLPILTLNIHQLMRVRRGHFYRKWMLLKDFMERGFFSSCLSKKIRYKLELIVFLCDKMYKLILIFFLVTYLTGKWLSITYSIILFVTVYKTKIIKILIYSNILKVRQDLEKVN